LLFEKVLAFSFALNTGLKIDEVASLDGQCPFTVAFSASATRATVANQ
jgi:hypothetical protein